MYLPPCAWYKVGIVHLVLHCLSYVPSYYYIEHPGFTLLWFCIQKIYTRWCKGSFVEDKWTLNCSACQHSWVLLAGYQHIQGHCCLSDETTQNMHGKLSICDCQTRDKMIIPCYDGPLRCIYMINVWGNQLVYNVFLSIILFRLADASLFRQCAHGMYAIFVRCLT